MRRIRRVLMALVAALAVIAGLSACAGTSTASAAGSGGSSSAPSSAPSSASSASQTPPSTSSSSALPKATCGGVSTRGPMGSPVRETTTGALSCFRKAAQSCSEASLLMTESGVDSGSSSVLALHREGSGCAVSVAVQTYVAPRPPRPVTHLDCGQVHVDSTGETVDCGKSGTYSIPVDAG